MIHNTPKKTEESSPVPELTDAYATDPDKHFQSVPDIGTDQAHIEYPEDEAYEKGFGVYFQKEIYPLLRDIEDKRLELVRSFYSRVGIGVPVALCAVVFGIILVPPGEWLFFLILATVGGIAVWIAAPFYHFRSQYKEQIIPLIAHFFGTFSFEAEGAIPDKTLTDSHIVPSYDAYHSEDFLEGTYEDVNIQFCEAHLTETHGSGKNRRTVTKFKGIFVEVDMNKNFEGQCIFKTDYGSIGNWFSSFSSGGMERVSLEDPDFESLFEVYATNQIEARYIFTTAFMERIKELTTAYKTEKVQGSFFHNKLFLMIPNNQNLFEPSFFHTCLTIGDIKTFLRQMHSVLQVVKVLKLQERTGL